MSHETAGSLPTLAHPLIVNPAEGVEEHKEPLRLLPFPEIDLNWEGFTFSHLHWVGFKIPNAQIPKENWSFNKVALLHEAHHEVLANTPFLLLKKHELFRLYVIIRKAFEEEKEQIEVPLDHENPRNELEKQWGILVRYQSDSMLVEEVFAVRSSIVQALKSGYISNYQLWKQIKASKEAYRKEHSSFPMIYDAFDFIARKLGEDAARYMALSVLETFKPNVSFVDIITKLCAINPSVPTNDSQWHVSDKGTHFIRNLSAGQMYSLFSKHFDRPGHNLLYRRRYMLETEAEIKKDLDSAAQNIKDDLGKFLSCVPAVFTLFSGYCQFGHRFYKLCDSPAIFEYGNVIIFLEAIRQQPTTGVGLLCPFWNMFKSGEDVVSIEVRPEYRARYECCSNRNKVFLEKVWSCTSHNRSCNWKRMGCLAKGGVAH